MLNIHNVLTALADLRRVHNAEIAAACAISQAEIKVLHEHLIAQEQRDKESRDAHEAAKKIAAAKKAA